MATADATNRKPWHLSGNYAPVMDELTETNLEVTGAIPPELSGLYVRNTPNPKTGESPHWFFGDGMLHGVRLEGGALPGTGIAGCGPPSSRAGRTRSIRRSSWIARPAPRTPT